MASRLLTLEDNGVISKMQHPESKAKVLYQLTEKGIDLLPVMIEIYLWGERYFSLSEAHIQFLKKIKNDKESFIQDLKVRLKDGILNSDATSRSEI